LSPPHEPLLSGPQIVGLLRELGVTHVVWLPDSAIGRWEEALEQASEAGDIQLIRVCREGEAWAVAAGLRIGGAVPMVMIQNTGLFESGDALRNVLLDMKLPIPAIIGYRSYLVENSTDSARHFTEPILKAWGLSYVVLTSDDPIGQAREHFVARQAAGLPAIVLLPEAGR
jgi:sulfopyruvate decarboxylase TPP-binding subunit